MLQVQLEVPSDVFRQDMSWCVPYLQTASLLLGCLILLSCQHMLCHHTRRQAAQAQPEQLLGMKLRSYFP